MRIPKLSLNPDMKLSYCMLFVLLTMPMIRGELKIISTTNGNLRPAPCALICTGVESHKSGWTEGGTEAYKKLDYAGCGFVSKPTITITLNGALCPSVYAFYTERSSTYVYTVEDVPASTLVIRQCDVHWTATGYNC